MTRRKFGQTFLLAITAAVLAPVSAIVSGCQKVLSALGKIIAALPTAAGIAKSILSVLSAFAPGLGEYGPLITTAVSAIGGALAELQDLITQYENNLAAAPAGTIGKADDAVGVIQANLDKITAIISGIAPNLLSPAARAAIALAVGGVESILLALTPYLSKAPATVKAAAPHSLALSTRQAQYPFTTAHDCAIRHNIGMAALGFPDATVVVPKA